MLQSKIRRRLSILVILVVLLTSVINTTYGYIVTKTDSFLNTFTPPEQEVPEGPAAEIRIHKLLENKSAQNMTPAGFTFGLFTEEGVPVKESAATSSDGETGIRMVYDLSDVGKTYTYVLKEIVPDQPVEGMIYDTTEHKIWISVRTGGDGSIKAVICDENTIDRESVSGGDVSCGDAITVSGGDMTAVSGGDDVADNGTVSGGDTDGGVFTPAVSNIYEVTFTNIYDPQTPDIPDVPHEPEEPDVPDEPDTPDVPKAPPTGEQSNAMRYIMVAGLSGVILILCLVAKCRKQKE